MYCTRNRERYWVRPHSVAQSLIHSLPPSLAPLSVAVAAVMLDWQNFDVVFHGRLEYTYDHRLVDSILRHRSELEGTLFFDRVWASVGLKQGETSFIIFFKSPTVYVSYSIKVLSTKDESRAQSALATHCTARRPRPAEASPPLLPSEGLQTNAQC